VLSSPLGPFRGRGSDPPVHGSPPNRPWSSRQSRSVPISFRGEGLTLTLSENLQPGSFPIMVVAGSFAIGWLFPQQTASSGRQSAVIGVLSQREPTRIPSSTKARPT